MLKIIARYFPVGAVPVKFFCTWLSGGSSFLPPVSALVELSTVSGMMIFFDISRT
jgi:hypothetical protein